MGRTLRWYGAIRTHNILSLIRLHRLQSMVVVPPLSQETLMQQPAVPQRPPVVPEEAAAPVAPPKPSRKSSSQWTMTPSSSVISISVSCTRAASRISSCVDSLWTHPSCRRMCMSSLNRRWTRIPRRKTRNFTTNSRSKCTSEIIATGASPGWTSTKYARGARGRWLKK